MTSYDAKTAEISNIPSTTPGHLWRVYVYKQPGCYAYATAVEGKPEPGSIAYIFPQPRRVERVNITSPRATPKAKAEAISAVLARLHAAGFITAESHAVALAALTGKPAAVAA